MWIDLRGCELRWIALEQGRTFELGECFRACEFVSLDDFAWM